MPKKLWIWHFWHLFGDLELGKTGNARQIKLRLGLVKNCNCMGSKNGLGGKDSSLFQKSPEINEFMRISEKDRI